ncbi:NUDIX domain-containing protein [Chishuiella changwenlii]|jgi:hypothetical protein|uniref:DNA mismatch repair protein MutT n=1 Tax=Chishuiella changwenlii TaxID=1434701 RepID=A0A1M7AH68_9FLAO|nr:NUDIX domain-containing protein [Chishuiella changwenlii]GGE90234.1 DNA mismatch repair protein MutT [Chishuiella changwenlii]SHL41839.1 NUDIX domain-containing protein [Chishuiella changwenlii]
MSKIFFENLEQSIQNIHLGLVVDCVIFTFHEQKMKVLLNKYVLNDKWMLPGGFIFKDEDVDAAAKRVLKERTGIDNVFLRQFHLFGKNDRVNIDEKIKLMENYGIASDKLPTFLNRFASMGYFSFVKFDEVNLIEKEDDIYQWFDLDAIPQLSYNHNEIINKAIKMIRIQFDYLPIGYQLLPKKFTIVELRKINEGILGIEVDKRNFRKKMLASNLIISLNEVRQTDPYPKPNLYKFNQETINELLDQET